MARQSAPSANVDAARLLLAPAGRLCGRPSAPAEDRASAPTFAEYIPVVRAAVTDAPTGCTGPIGTGLCSSGYPAAG